jgi:hypothetical protein
VNPPQDGVHLNVSNKDTLLHSASDLATVHAAHELEAASGVISEMRGIAASAQCIASEINFSNPIALADSISSFLKTLAKFNDVVRNIATVILCYTLIKASILIFYLDPPLRTSSVDNPLFCFQGPSIAHLPVLQFHDLCLSDNY